MRRYARCADENMSEVVTDDAVSNDKCAPIVVKRLVGSFNVKLVAPFRSCRATLRIRRVYEWPSTLSAVQARRLSSMTKIDWKRFFRTVSSRLRADVTLKGCDDDEILARVFFSVTSFRHANRRRFNKFKILRDDVQINANGGVYMRQTTHSHGLRVSPRRRMTRVGECPWTTRKNAVLISGL